MSVFPAPHEVTLLRRPLGLVAALLLPLLAGCPGELDPAFKTMSFGSGSGGTTASGGSTGSGGSSGSGGGTGSGGSSGRCDAPAMIFDPSSPFACAQAGCHGDPSFSTPPDLRGDPGPALKGATATSLAASPCENQPLVDTTNIDNSVLLKLVSGTSCNYQVSGATNDVRMPLGGPNYLNADQIACLRDWISKIP